MRKGLERISEESLQPDPETKTVELVPMVEESPAETDKVELPSDGSKSSTGLTVQEVAQDLPVDATPTHEELQPKALKTYTSAVPDGADAPGPIITTLAKPVSKPRAKSPTAADLDMQPEHLDDLAPLKNTIIQQPSAS